MESIFWPTLAVCFSALMAISMWLEFKREEREHKDIVSLSSRLEQELSKIDEMKLKLDSIAIKVGINTSVKYAGNSRP